VIVGEVKLPRELKQIRFTLSNRELEIINLIFYDEKSPREIANELGISIGTVNSHLENVRKRYDVASTPQCVYRYIKEKYQIVTSGTEENSSFQRLSQ
jgi:DNA-binding CsgD family transcriptional regulator